MEDSKVCRVHRQISTPLIVLGDILSDQCILESLAHRQRHIFGFCKGVRGCGLLLIQLGDSSDIKEDEDGKKVEDDISEKLVTIFI